MGDFWLTGTNGRAIHIRRSVNHALTMFSAMIAAAFCWFFLRYPDDSILTVTTSLFCAGMAYDIRSARDRFTVILITVTLAAVFQYLTVVLLSGKILILIADTVMPYLAFRLIPNRKAASIAVCIGLLSQAMPANNLLAENVFLDLYFAALPSAFLATAFVPLIHVRENWVPVWDGGFTKEEAIRVSLSSLIGSWIFFACKVPQGVWLPATVSFLYMNKQPGQDIAPAGLLRIWGTAAGMYAGFLYLGCLTFFEYRLIYLLPFAATLGFFILYCYQNYFLYTLCFMMSYCLYADFNASQNEAMNLASLISGRVISSTLGALLAILFDRYLLPEGRHHAK